MIVQRTFALHDSEAAFLLQFAGHGFRSEADMLSKALALLKAQIEREKQLAVSADLYSEIYAEDVDLQELTDAASATWPN